MKLNVSDIYGYYINPDHYSHRTEKIQTLSDSLGLKLSERFVYNDKHKTKQITMTKAHLALIDKAISLNHFPLLILEDDATMIKEKVFPKTFNIPDQAELVYFGGSTYNCGGVKPDMYIENYNEDFFRVYYMLSAHALLIPKINNVDVIIEAYNESIKAYDFNDVYLSLKSKNHVFVTPKDGPYFYQDDYTSDVTKYSWSSVEVKN